MSTLINLLRKDESVRIYNKEMSVVITPSMLLDPQRYPFVKLLDSMIKVPIVHVREDSLIHGYSWEVKI